MDKVDREIETVAKLVDRTGTVDLAYCAASWVRARAGDQGRAGKPVLGLLTLPQGKRRDVPRLRNYLILVSSLLGWKQCRAGARSTYTTLGTQAETMKVPYLSKYLNLVYTLLD